MRGKENKVYPNSVDENIPLSWNTDKLKKGHGHSICPKSLLNKALDPR